MAKTFLTLQRMMILSLPCNVDLTLFNTIFTSALCIQSEMENLWGYARDLFQTPGFGDTIDFQQIKAHYYATHTDINPTKIIPSGPDISVWYTKHHREKLGGEPFGDGAPPAPTQ